MQDSNKSEIVSKAKEVALNEYDKVFNKDKASFEKNSSSLTVTWEEMYPTKDTSEWRDDCGKLVDDLSNIYLNENGELCILTEIQHPGGQWSCWKTIIINSSNDNSVTELTLGQNEE